MFGEARARSRRWTALAVSTLVAAVTMVGAPAAHGATCQVGRPLRWGSRGADVTCLETALSERGYPVTPDQFYGSVTADKVRRFQIAGGLPADGIARLTTLAALGIVAPVETASPADHARDDSVIQSLVLGTSVEGREITAIERGTPGGRVVLAVGTIHGDENAGDSVIAWLRQMPVPPGIDLWLVPSINPDGEAHGTRHNANGVDLNRNFPRKWAPLGSPGNWQYGGTGPASEPETQAMVSLLDKIKPAVTIWYHQDLNQVDPAGDPTIYNAYAEVAKMPVINVTGGTYTGTATQYCYGVSPNGTAFVVELPPRLPGVIALRHATAVFAAVQP